jgi:HK97 gp10 family phage protein
MKSNNFVFKDMVKDFEKDMNAVRKKKAREAAKIFAKKLRQSIKSRVGKKTGNLLKGVKYNIRPGVAVVGMAAPAFHAHFLEHGTEERIDKNGKSSGKMPQIEFFLPAYRDAEQEIINYVSEEWL